MIVIALLAAVPVAANWSRLDSTVSCQLGIVALRHGLVMQQRRPEEPNPYLDRALRLYLRAVDANPGNAYAWRHLGDLYLFLGQNEAARQALASALALRPDNTLYHILLGDAYDGLGLSRQAVAEWQAGDAGAWRRDQTVVNLTKLADAHIQLGDPLSALPILEREVLVLDPTNLLALATVAHTYDSAAGGRHPLAEAYREKLALMTPEQPRLSADPRYIAFESQSLTLLYAWGYWDAAKIAAQLGYWRDAGYAAAEQATEALRQIDPTNPAWAAREGARRPGSAFALALATP